MDITGTTLNLLQHHDRIFVDGFEFHENISFFPFMILIAIFSFLATFFIAYLVYRDAKKNDDPNAALWFIVVFFATFIGVILYLIFRSQNKHRVDTSYYHGPPPRFVNKQSTSQYTTQSTTTQETVSKPKYCKNCGSKLDFDSRFCSDCGFEVST